MVMDKLVLINMKTKKAFTLVEILVSLAIFTIFITLALSVLFVSNASSKRSTAIKTAIDNVQYSLEVFTRNARLGTMYTCMNKGDLSVSLSPISGVDCAYPDGHGVAFLLYEPSNVPGQTDMFAYFLDDAQGNGRIMRCFKYDVYSGGPSTALPIVMDTSSTGDCMALTAQEVDINKFDIGIVGSDPTDLKQPSIQISISGNVLVNDSSTPFSLQTYVSQRQYE